MRTERTCQTERISQRRAFTLVELLVVIAIIGIIAGLLAIAAFSWVDRQRSRNSEALINAVHQTLRQHWSKVVEDAKKETIPQIVMSMAGGSSERARILWIKLRLVEAFPMTYYEAAFPPRFFDHTSGQWIPLIPAGQQKYFTVYLNKLKPTAATDPNTESAACLLTALSVSKGSIQALNWDALPLPPQDSDGDGVTELVDGFGAPLAFFRFPTDPVKAINSGLQLANPAPKNSMGVPNYGDPLDSKNMLYTGGWWDAAPPPPQWNARRIFQEVCRYTLEEEGSFPHARFAYYTMPVIVGRGSDGILGLKLLETVHLTPAMNAPPASPMPTQHQAVLSATSPNQYDYPDMRILDPNAVKDNIYSFKLATPQ